MTRETEKPPLIPWHRLFGLLLSDYLKNTPFSVELEVDLSQRKQLLDIIVVRKESGDLTKPMPDGLSELAQHNLISFKSFRETLDDWALRNLLGIMSTTASKPAPKRSYLLKTGTSYLPSVPDAHAIC
jgi:hypothetical protein